MVARLSTYKDLKIVQYDRGNMGEFISLMLHSMFYEPVLDHRRKDLNSYNFMAYDGSLDSLLYDMHRSAEPVTMQNEMFGTCVYDCMLRGQVDRARSIFAEMTKLRQLHPKIKVDDVFSRGDYSYSYLDDMSPNYDCITRIHNFHRISLEDYFPGSTIYSVFCPPEKRWIFKFLYFYKKKLDNNQERLQRGLREFWDFNWNMNQNYDDRYIMIDCYEIFAGGNLFFDKSLCPVIKRNSESNIDILKKFNLDYRMDYVSSDDLLGIVSSFFQSGDYHGH